jgi:hypothetical protein
MAQLDYAGDREGAEELVGLLTAGGDEEWPDFEVGSAGGRARGDRSSWWWRRSGASQAMGGGSLDPSRHDEAPEDVEMLRWLAKPANRRRRRAGRPDLHGSGGKLGGGACAEAMQGGGGA